MIIHPTFDHELELAAEGRRLVAGVDEVGRGPLAGPVMAAAVILPEEWLRWRRRRKSAVKKGRRRQPDPREWLRDSKQLSARQREVVCDSIVSCAVAYGVGVSTVETIDSRGIVQATKQAMCQAIAALEPRPDAILVDALDLPEAGLPCRPITDGDALCGSVAAASIVAKVARDRLMRELDEDFPGYGFARNKGYATREHLHSIHTLGPASVHRRSFSPIKEILLTPRLL